MDGQKIINMVHNNFFVYVICLVTLIFCAFALLNMGGFKDDCNEYWIGAINDRPGMMNPNHGIPMFNESFKIKLNWGDGESDKSSSG